MRVVELFFQLQLIKACNLVPFIVTVIILIFVIAVHGLHPG